MQLNENTEAFKDLSVNVAAMSYDSTTQNAAFSYEQALQYPLLSDQKASTVKALGILNEEYEEGHPAYGIPHPGVILVTPDGKIGLKRAVPDYKERPEFGELLNAVRDAVASS
ncbi:MAG: redoxin domain-containing protein [Gammaproteobacteria bacterium]|nr:redoxin domain-containing protein [Gammaproteobacteria bacterium]